MNTRFSAVFAGTEDEALCASAAAEAFARVDELELLLSRFHDSGDPAVIRSLHPGEVAAVAPETMKALLVSARACALTGGAFDPTLAPVMDLLRRPADGSSRWNAVDAEELADAFARTGMNRLVLDPDRLRVSVTVDARGRATPVELDFGGVGKGLALDACAAIFRSARYELTDWLLDAGTSTVLVDGSRDPRAGGGWPLGVGGPWKERTRRNCRVTLVTGEALSGSGFEIQGEHVVDPRGRAAANRWGGAWVRCGSAALADALSTAALSLPPSALRALARDAACTVFVARRQAPWWDRFRDPLCVFGAPEDAERVAAKRERSE